MTPNRIKTIAHKLIASCQERDVFDALCEAALLIEILSPDEDAREIKTAADELRTLAATSSRVLPGGVLPCR